MNDKLWVIIHANGDHFTLEKEPLEGILVWAKGQAVTVREYTFSSVVYYGITTTNDKRTEATKK